MFETSDDELFLPPYQDEELVDNLLSGEPSDGRGSALSLAEALLPVVEPPPSSAASPLAPWVCSSRYKTELCTSYAATGLCAYAARCQFAHGLRELHVPFRHPKYKTELCRSFHAAGRCHYGARCLFVHGAAELRPAGGRRRGNVPCRTFSSYGVCPFGTRCNFLHVEGGAAPGAAAREPRPRGAAWRPRGALCRTFSAFGFCLYGTRCRFQHALPAEARGAEQPGAAADRVRSRGSDALSSPSSSSSPSSPASPPADAAAHDAFAFSSQHLSDLLLPLALHLQQLEGGLARSTWDNRAL